MSSIQPLGSPFRTPATLKPPLHNGSSVTKHTVIIIHDDAITGFALNDASLLTPDTPSTPNQPIENGTPQAPKKTTQFIDLTVSPVPFNLSGKKKPHAPACQLSTPDSSPTLPPSTPDQPIELQTPGAPQRNQDEEKKTPNNKFLYPTALEPDAAKVNPDDAEVFQHGLCIDDNGEIFADGFVVRGTRTSLSQSPDSVTKTTPDRHAEGLAVDTRKRSIVAENVDAPVTKNKNSVAPRASVPFDYGTPGHFAKEQEEGSERRPILIKDDDDMDTENEDFIGSPPPLSMDARVKRASQILHRTMDNRAADTLRRSSKDVQGENGGITRKRCLEEDSDEEVVTKKMRLAEQKPSKNGGRTGTRPSTTPQTARGKKGPGSQKKRKPAKLSLKPR